MTRVLTAVIWFLDLLNEHVYVYRMAYMHGVDIYYIEGFFLTLGDFSDHIFFYKITLAIVHTLLYYLGSTLQNN